GIKWDSFELQYSGELPVNAETPEWMTKHYEVVFRDVRELTREMLANPDYHAEVDIAPFREFDTNGERRFEDFMSGDWSWQQADLIAQDPNTHGAMFVPWIMGSDKTTVSVATGQNEYYPLYGSIGNVRNGVRRAHRDALVLVGFLAIPKTDKKHAGDAKFRKFRRQLFHTSLSKILQSLKPGMSTPEVALCSDGHYRRVIYGLGPYIADYPEQALLACIVQGWCPKCTASADKLDDAGAGRRSREHTETLVRELELGELWEEYGLVGDLVPFTNDFPRADIHELLSPDLLHQLIKGTFKDHLVTWVEEYLVIEHGRPRANEILDDIDRRMAAVPPFSGLRRFPQGRGFKQWTGDDSKALMKVWLPAIEGYVPRDMLRACRALLEFCYMARQNVFVYATLKKLDDTLTQFHTCRTIFQACGVRPEGFSLPRQHSLVHYSRSIRLFGAPNGLCSSITESKHIKAVKEPWRRSNRYNALSQILTTNQRLDKLAACRVDFANRDSEAALNNSHCNMSLTDLNDCRENHNSRDPEDPGDDVDGPRHDAYVNLARTPRRRLTSHEVATELGIPQFPNMVRRFLQDQIHPDRPFSSEIPLITECPSFRGKLSEYNSAAATYYAPSDLSGTGGMHREHIRATLSWGNGPARYDCMLVNVDPSLGGFRGLDAVRVRMFFSFEWKSVIYPCALVEWYRRTADEASEDTGMWVVERDLDADTGEPVGNQDFANYVDAHVTSLNHINNKLDPIPIVPGMFLGYHHPSGEIHIDETSSAWISCPCLSV
ncbi:hypothetical protein PHLCEN_2v1705, partial [Hermanssonia centrifuga]